MASCNDCIYNEICQKFGGPFNINDADTSCTDFKSRSRFVELPCLPGDKVFYFDTDERIYVQKVESLIYGLTKTGFVINSEVDFISDLLGERFFLSYEEAKKALKEREENA